MILFPNSYNPGAFQTANINPLSFRTDTSLSTSFILISSDLSAFEELLHGQGFTVLAAWLPVMSTYLCEKVHIAHMALAKGNILLKQLCFLDILSQ